MAKNKKPTKKYNPNRIFRQNKNFPTIFEMKRLFDPLHETFDAIESGEVKSVRGIPVMMYEGSWTAIHEAILGWAACWQRICDHMNVIYDPLPLHKLAKKLENGVMAETSDVAAAREVIELTRRVFMKTPTDVLKEYSITEQIAIEFEKLDLLGEAA